MSLGIITGEQNDCVERSKSFLKGQRDDLGTFKNYRRANDDVQDARPFPVEADSAKSDFVSVARVGTAVLSLACHWHLVYIYNI